MESDTEVGSWDTELESLLLRVGERFGRVEPRRRMRDYVRGLLGPVGRKNNWPIAEPRPSKRGPQKLSLLGWCGEHGYDGPKVPAWAERMRRRTPRPRPARRWPSTG